MAYELNPQGIDWLWQRFQQVVDPTARATVAAQKQGELAGAQAQTAENTALRDFIAQNPQMAQQIIARNLGQANVGETNSRSGLLQGQTGLVGMQTATGQNQLNEQQKAQKFAETKGLKKRGGLSTTLPGTPYNIASAEVENSYRDAGADATDRQVATGEKRAGTEAKLAENAMDQLPIEDKMKLPSFFQKEVALGRMTPDKAKELEAAAIINPKAAAAEYAAIAKETARQAEWQGAAQNAVMLKQKGQSPQAAMDAYDAKFGQGAFIQDQRRYLPVGQKPGAGAMSEANTADHRGSADYKAMQSIPTAPKQEPNLFAPPPQNPVRSNFFAPATPNGQYSGQEFIPNFAPPQQVPRMGPAYQKYMQQQQGMPQPSTDVPIPQKTSQYQADPSYTPQQLSAPAGPDPAQNSSNMLAQFLQQMGMLNAQQGSEDSARMMALLKMAGMGGAA